MSHGGLETAIIERLVAAGAKREGNYLRGIACPVCGEREAFTYAEPQGNAKGPFTLFCPRGNRCGAMTSVKQVFPDLFEQFRTYHPATDADPKATARAFLRSRGLGDARFESWYEQGRAKGTLDEQTYPTLAFRIPGCEATRHRLIDYSASKGKTKIFGSYRGRVWNAPDFKPEGWIWLVEGIEDALSLIVAGQQAVATLTAKAVPKDWLESLDPARVRLIVALDTDRAGREGSRKLAAALREMGFQAELAVPPAGKDWNDLLLAGRLGEDTAKDTLEEARWRGRLEEAGDATEHFRIWRERRRSLLFEYAGSCYMGQVKEREGQAEYTVRRISNFTMRMAYTVARASDDGEPQYAYRLAVTNHRSTHTLTLEGEELAMVNKFRSAMLSRARCQWLGSAQELDLVVHELLASPAHIVRELDFVGYDRLSACYVFRDTVVDPEGKHHGPDKNGLLVAGKHRFSVPPSEEERPIIPTGTLDTPHVLDLLVRAYGLPAMALLGFGTAALFAEQISLGQGWFPFLSLHGPPGTGKSTLIKLLHRLHARGVDEGLALNQVDTKKGSTRVMANVSNLPVVLLEMSEAKAEHFDLERLLPLFDRNGLQTTAIRSNDNRYRTKRFRGALIFTGNHEHFHGPAQRSRVVSLYFDDERLSDATREALVALEGLDPGLLADFRRQVLQRRGWWLKHLQERAPVLAQWLRGEGIHMGRVASTHGLLLAGMEGLALAFLPGDRAEKAHEAAAQYVLERAQAKLASLHEENDYLATFFGTVAKLLLRDKVPDHTPHEKAGEEAWLSLPEIKEALENEKMQWNFAQLLEELSGSPRVLEKGKSRWSWAAGKNMQLWRFDRRAFTE